MNKSAKLFQSPGNYCRMGGPDVVIMSCLLCQVCEWLREGITRQVYTGTVDVPGRESLLR